MRSGRAPWAGLVSECHLRSVPSHRPHGVGGPSRASSPLDRELSSGERAAGENLGYQPGTAASSEAAGPTQTENQEIAIRRRCPLLSCCAIPSSPGAIIPPPWP